jgi:hypothetical protein
MKTSTVILTLGLFSCGQTTADQKGFTNSNNSISKAITPHTFLDSRLKEYLDSAFKGWTLPAPYKWDTIWFNQYKRNGNLANYVKGDFDCNKEQDYTLLFNKSDGTLVAYAFLSRKKSFEMFELFDFGIVTSGQIEFGLELISPGRINYMDPESEEAPSVLIKCDAVQVLSFEKGAETYYWEKGKLKSVMTGD